MGRGIMKSVLQTEKECYLCHTTQNLESHHIFFGTSNRRISEFHGFKVWLCNRHHTGGPDAVHRNREVDLCLKEMAQFYYEENVGSRESFITEFGKSYL